MFGRSRRAAGPGEPRDYRKIMAGVVLLLALVFGGPLYGMATSNARVDPELRGEDEARVTVAVHLGFKPEQFHRRILDRHGMFAGRIEDDVLRYARVTPSGLKALGRIYWIDRVERVERP